MDGSSVTPPQRTPDQRLGGPLLYVNDMDSEASLLACQNGVSRVSRLWHTLKETGGTVKCKSRPIIQTMPSNRVNEVTGHAMPSSKIVIEPSCRLWRTTVLQRSHRPRPAADVHIILVLDQAGWHQSKDPHVPANITLLHLPSYSPEFNPVERLWAHLKSHYLSNHAYSSYGDLFNACGQAWNHLISEQLCSICQTQWILRKN